MVAPGERASSCGRMMTSTRGRQRPGGKARPGSRARCILMADHASRMDTPVHPRRAAVAPAQSCARGDAAADYFYRPASLPRPSRSSWTRCRSSVAAAGWGRGAAAVSDSCSTRARTCCSFPRGNARATAAGRACPRGRGTPRRRRPVDRPDPGIETGTRAAMPPRRLSPKRIHGKLMLGAAVGSTSRFGEPKFARCRTPAQHSSSACRTLRQQQQRLVGLAVPSRGARRHFHQLSWGRGPAAVRAQGLPASPSRPWRRQREASSLWDGASTGSSTAPAFAPSRCRSPRRGDITRDAARLYSAAS